MSEKCIDCGKPVRITSDSKRLCDNPDCLIQYYRVGRDRVVYSIHRASSLGTPSKVVGTTEAQESEPESARRKSQ